MQLSNVTLQISMNVLFIWQINPLHSMVYCQQKKSGNAAKKPNIFNSKQHFKFITCSPLLHYMRTF